MLNMTGTMNMARSEDDNMERHIKNPKSDNGYKFEKSNTAKPKATEIALYTIAFPLEATVYFVARTLSLYFIMLNL